MKHKVTKTVLMAAGGTGGHIFPALAIANTLKKDHPNINVQWIGSKFGMENNLVPKYGYHLQVVNSVGLRGKSLKHLLQAPFLLFIALLQTVKIFYKVKPDVVLAMGGFSAGITGVVAKIFATPLMIHEQNAITGSTNRILSKLANYTYQAFDDTFGEKVGAITCGNPIVFTPIKKQPTKLPLKTLIMGGSLGARVINQTIPKLITPLNIKHQTGKGNLALVKADYAQYSNNQVEIFEFIDDMASAYGWADIVICRAGAMTISELIHSGSASILIPYPYAIDNHQTYNAHILSNHQAGILLPQTQLSVQKLDKILTELSPEKIQTLSSCAQQLPHGNINLMIDRLLNA